MRDLLGCRRYFFGVWYNGIMFGRSKSQSIDGMRQVKKPATGVVGRDGLARRGNEKIKTNKSLTRKKQEAVRPSTQWDVNGLVNQEVKEAHVAKMVLQQEEQGGIEGRERGRKTEVRGGESRLFNMRKSGKGNAKVRAEDGEELLDAESLPWRQGDEAGARDVGQEEAERRRNRIIKFFEAEKAVTVTPEEIVGFGSRSLKELKKKRTNDLKRTAIEEDDPKVDAKQREEFLQRLVRGEISVEDETEFLLLMPGSELSLHEMFEKIAQDPRQTQILAVAAGYNLSNYQKVDTEAVARIIGEVQENGDDYRTPVGFMSLRLYFLQGIRPKANEQVYRKYVQSMNELERTLYGERLDYYRQFELMRKLARERRETGKVGLMPELKYERKELVEVSAERSSEMLGRVVIEGDAWKSGGVERHLTSHNLSMAKLGPAYEVELEQGQMWLSEIFQLTNGSLAAMAYVLTGAGLKVRSYYKDSARGMWRYLPDYVRRGDDTIERYGMGYSVESVTLPVELQEILMQIEEERGVRSVKEPEFFLAGATYGYSSMQEYQTTWSYGRMRGDYYQEVAQEPINHDFNLHSTGQRKTPYTLSIDYNRAPDFVEMVAKFEFETADAGKAVAEGFRSHDGQFIWLFCKDMRGRVWIEYVEAVSMMTSMGLRQEWTMMGDFTTKLYEHANEAGIYGDRTDMKGARQGMWRNYLSNVPMVKEYLER